MPVKGTLPGQQSVTTGTLGSATGASSQWHRHEIACYEFDPAYSAIAACDAIGGQGDGGGNGCASIWNCADAPVYAAQPASAVIAVGGLSVP